MPRGRKTKRWEAGELTSRAPIKENHPRFQSDSHDEAGQGRAGGANCMQAFCRDRPKNQECENK